MSLVIKGVVFILFIFLCVFAASFFISPDYFSSNSETDKERQFTDIRGKVEFESYCASCHGKLGAGDGPSSITLSKLPPNFLNSQSRYVNGFQEEGLKKTLANGIPNSQMPKFNYLPEKVKENIVFYLIYLHENSIKNQN
jgi:hypothetical protein